MAGLTADLTGAAAQEPGEALVIVSCFAPGGALLAAGSVRLLPGTPGRVTFPAACAGSARVRVAPVEPGAALALDDLAFVPGGPWRRRRRRLRTLERLAARRRRLMLRLPALARDG